MEPRSHLGQGIELAGAESLGEMKSNGKGEQREGAHTVGRESDIDGGDVGADEE